LLIIVAVGFVAYANSFHVPFQWDGTTYIGDNQIIRSLDYFVHPSHAKARHFYSQLSRRYVPYLTFALNYRVNGFNYPGWHLVNILIHIANALMCFALVLRLFKTPLLKDSQLSESSQTIAFFCALFFVAHPMQTMAVTYIYQRLASLVTLFYLAAALAYLSARLSEDARKRYLLYAAAFLLFAIALKTKENAATLPLALAAMEFTFFTGPWKRRLLGIVPFFAIAAAMPIFLLARLKLSGDYLTQYNEATQLFQKSGSHLEYLPSQFRANAQYLRLYLLPFGQSLVHNSLKVKSFLDATALLSLAFLCSLAGGAVWLFKKGGRQRPELLLIAFGIAWYFITQSLESGIARLPLDFQEYRAYLPSVGIFISCVTASMMVIDRLSTEALRRAALCGMVGVAIIFGIMTHERNKVWATPMSLWQEVVERAPTNPRGYNNLGLIYAKEGMPDKALPLYREAIKMDPGFGKAYNNMGKLLMTTGDAEGAEKALQMAVKIDPDTEEALSNLGSIYSAKGEYKLALENLDKSLKANPDFAIAWYNRGLLYQRTNNIDNAISDYTNAIALDPTLHEAHTNLGAIYVKRKDYDLAIKHLGEAVRLNPSSAKAHYNIGYALYRGGYINAAEVEAEKSLRIDPAYERSRRLIRTLKEIESQRR